MIGRFLCLFGFHDFGYAACGAAGEWCQRVHCGLHRYDTVRWRWMDRPTPKQEK